MSRFPVPGNRLPQNRSGPQVDGVVDARCRRASTRATRRRRRRELDADHRLEVGAGARTASAMSTGCAGPARASTRTARRTSGSTVGIAPAEPRAERRAGGVVVDHERRAAAAYDPVELGQAGLAAGPEEVGPARVHDVDRRVGQRERLRGPCEHVDVAGSRRVRRRASATRSGCGSTPITRAAVGGEARQVEAGAAAEVEHGAAGPVGDRRHRGLDQPVGVDGAVLDLVGRRVLPDVGAGHRSRRESALDRAELDADEAVRASGTARR